MTDTLQRPQDTPSPKLRGLIHLIMSPIALISGLILIAMADKMRARISLGIFTLAAVLLFTCSALYHRVPWKPKTKAIWRRIDHANITILIAGTYTPFAVFLLNKDQAIVLLALVWSGAIATTILRVSWINAPRWLYVPIYLILGWAPLMYLPTFWQHGGIAVFILMMLGGLCYSAGSIIYGMKRPNFSTKWFGFHELFHALTAAAFTFQFIAAAIVVYQHK